MCDAILRGTPAAYQCGRSPSRAGGSPIPARRVRFPCPLRRSRR